MDDSAHVHRVSATTGVDGAYVFGGADPDSELTRLRLIESVFDPKSRRALLDAGLGAGARCLEIGAGAGSIARWLSEVVGPTGKVAAVDVDTRYLAGVASGNIEVHEADLRTVELETSSFDVVHARFVFIHLADGRAALDAALRLLKPGGRLVLEEPDFSASRPLAGDAALCSSVDRVNRAIAAMFTARGMDPAFGLRLPSRLLARELDLIAVENDAPIVPGGSPMAAMMGLSTRQLREKYLATGLVTAADLDHFATFAASPACWAIYHGTVRVTARNARETR